MTEIPMTPTERNALHALRFMREERDEARRECCRWMAEAEGGTPEEHAQEMGWDCFGVTTRTTEDSSVPQIPRKENNQANLSDATCKGILYNSNGPQEIEGDLWTVTESRSPAAPTNKPTQEDTQ